MKIDFKNNRQKLLFGGLSLLLVLCLVGGIFAIVASKRDNFAVVSDVSHETESTSSLVASIIEAGDISGDITVSSGNNSSVIVADNDDNEGMQGESTPLPPDKPQVTEFSYDLLTSPAVYVYRVSDKKVLFSKNSDEKLAPASLTKLATALTALYFVSPETVFSVGDEQDLVHKGSSLCNIKKGQQITLSDLIAGMLICSGNDAAYCTAVNVARHVSKNPEMPTADAVNYFMELVNKHCDSLGLRSSNFVCPDGWDTENHYSTANDVFILSFVAYQNPTIRGFCGQSQYGCIIESGETMLFKNSNPLVRTDSKYYLDCTTGLKTGSTDNAGYCLSAVAEKDGETIFTVVLGQKKATRRNAEVRAILKHALGIEISQDELNELA